MAEVLDARTTEATLATRKEALARTLESKLAQGYTIETQTDTQAVLVIKGRRRRFRSSVDTRQVVSVDEFGSTRFEKIENAAV